MKEEEEEEEEEEADIKVSYTVAATCSWADPFHCYDG